jgi:hypothetical protein
LLDGEGHRGDCAYEAIGAYDGCAGRNDTDLFGRMGAIVQYETLAEIRLMEADFHVDDVIAGGERVILRISFGSHQRNV